MTLSKTVAVLAASAALNLMPGLSQPVLAQQVGTATAVNPAAESTPPGGSTGPLTVGAHVVHKERIHTSSSGSAQLLFLDKSSLSIAPNTTISIDEFVYNPGSGSGHAVTKLTQGALRYVGGQLSHEGQAVVSTPAATIGIRGGTATISSGGGGVTITCQNGRLTVTNGTGTITLITGFTIFVRNWNSPLGQPVKTDINLAMHDVQLIMSKLNQVGGVDSYKGQGALCGTPTTPACPLLPWTWPYGGQYDATQLGLQGTQLGTGQTQVPHHQGGRCSFGC
jgi:hypothetical protein